MFHPTSTRRQLAPKLAFAAVLALAATTASAVTKLPIYPSRGKQNPVTYTFVAQHRGDITVWFAGSGASFIETVGLLINGVSTGITGLNNKNSVYGDKLVLGHVKRGDKFVFSDYIATTKKTFYSDKALNFDHVNHAYATNFVGDAKIPAGTYFGFEDVVNGGDFSYTDETFVFNNVLNSTVPEPASWTLMIAGFALIGATQRLAMRRRKVALAA